MIQAKFTQLKIWAKRKMPKRHKIKPGSIVKYNGDYCEVISYLGKNRNGKNAFKILDIKTGATYRQLESRMTLISE